MQTTNYITFPERKHYLRRYLDFVLTADDNHAQYDYIRRARKQFYALLQTLVGKPPADYQFRMSENTLDYAIPLPAWKHINTDSNFYISYAGGKIIVDYVDAMFWSSFEIHLNNTKSIRRETSLYLFLEQNNLTVDNLDMLAKRAVRLKQQKKVRKTTEITSAFDTFLSN